MHEEFAYYNEHIRCYRSGKIELLINGKYWRETSQRPTKGSHYPVTFVKELGRSESNHKLIWIAFNGDIPNGYHIHHKNEIKYDNRLENLECISVGQHLKEHTYQRIKFCKETKSKPVIGIHIKTGEKIEFPSTREASRNGFNQQYVCYCCNGKPKYKSHKGYRWYYKDDLDLTV